MRSLLLEGASEAELSALCPRRERYAKGERVLAAGEIPRGVGVVESGSLLIYGEDEAGLPVLLARVEQGGMFAEAFAFASVPAGADAVAAEDCAVLWLDAARIAEDGVLARNALRILAEKSIFLTRRIRHLTRRTLADKVRSYLREQAAGVPAGATFFLPLDRQGLADFLGCDRSALSAVLSRLREAGEIDFHKNAFRLKNTAGRGKESL